jgi:hypothetical protein
MDKSYKEPNFCNFLIHWTQTDPICWFNALLMATLFSQRSRKLVTQTIIEKWKMKTVVDNANGMKHSMYIPDNLQSAYDLKIFDVIYRIIRYMTHRRNLKKILYKNDVQFFQQYNSVRILQLLHAFNPQMFPISKPQGSKSYFYIKRFYDIMNVNSIMFDKNASKISYSFMNDARILSNSAYTPKRLSKTELSQELKKEYDIIIICVNGAKLIKPEYYMVENTELGSLNNVIYFNNNEYELDSIILTNWNDTPVGHHAIAGITCDKQKFVYNGWYEGTRDPSMDVNYQRMRINTKKTHCPLMKYEWNQHIDDPRHLNPNTCELEQHANDKRLSFSFAKGERMLIYVRKPHDEQLKKQYELEQHLLTEHEKVINGMQHEGGRPRKPKPATCKTSKTSKTSKTCKKTL